MVNARRSPAAPPPHPAPRPSPCAGLLAVLVAAAALARGAAAAPPPPPRMPPMPACPGVAGGECTYACQRATCVALAAFFKSAHNESVEWEPRSEDTWGVLKESTCDELVPRPPRGAARAARPPAYCELWGVDCCTPPKLAAGVCGPLFSVSNISIKADSVNGSIDDPLMLSAFDQLHACGLTGLSLESNDVGGSLGPRWGRYTNLTVLNLGEQQARRRGRGGARAAWRAGRGGAPPPAAAPAVHPPPPTPPPPPPRRRPPRAPRRQQLDLWHDAPRAGQPGEAEGAGAGQQLPRRQHRAVVSGRRGALAAPGQAPVAWRPARGR